MPTNLHCKDALPLVPRYLDGELPEREAGPLRRHLLECQPCRTATQGEKALKRWFQAEAQVEVPPGFAARVARLAFAGASSAAPALELEPALAAGASDAASRGASPEPGAPAELTAHAEPTGGQILSFVLKLTAAAAVLLIALSGWMRSVQLPADDDLRAEDSTPASYQELVDELELLNAEPVEDEAAERPR